MCPGKDFFLGEASSIVATLLLAYDVRLAVPGAALPPSNLGRIGLVMGLDPAFVTHPSIDIEWRRKTQSCSKGQGG